MSNQLKLTCLKFLSDEILFIGLSDSTIYVLEVSERKFKILFTYNLNIQEINYIKYIKEQ